ncbi:phage tail tape measure protein [Aeromonas caviae]|uniref:phage tail tape measure protein n=1 Tax=Aeromonas caviae TaxID=648 RepID=UPI002B46A741|nr:phage tail tape measure protein [Aeromonas caviae]
MNPLKLQILLGAVDKITAPLKAVSGQSRLTAQDLLATKKRIKELETQSGQIDGYRTLGRQIGATRAQLNQAQRDAQQMAQQFAKVEQPTKAMTRAMEQAKQKVRDLSQQEREMVARHGSLKRAMNEAGINTKQLGDHQRRLKTDLAAANGQLDQQRAKLGQLADQQKRLNQVKASYDKTMSMRGTMAGYGAAGMATGAAGLYKINSIASVGLDFDAQMSKVQALTRLQKGSAELAMLRQQARDLGASTSFTAMDAAGGQGFLAMAGFTPQNIKAAMPGILDMAKAGGMEIARTADIASNILSGFQLPATEMGRVGDSLVATFTRSNTSLEMLGETMKYAAPIAAGLGVDMETVSAMAGKLGDAGVQGSMAGTGISAILTRLVKPTKEVRGALDALGVKAKDATGKLRDPLDLLEDIERKTSKMADGGVAYLAAISGQEALKAMIPLVAASKKGADSVRALRDSVYGATGEAAEVARVMADNARGDIDGLTSAWQDLNIELMTSQNGPLRGLIQQITAMTRGVGEWMRKNPELTATIAKVAAITAVAAAAGGSLLLVVAGLMGPLAMLKFALGGTLVRLGGLFLSANKTTESLSMFSRMMALNSRMAAPLLAKWAALGNVIKGLSFAKIGAGMKAMLTTITSLPTKIGAMTAATWRYVTAQLAASKATAATKFTSMMNGLKGATTATYAYIAANGVMGTTMNMIKGSVGGVISLLKGGLVGSLKLVGQTIAFVGRLLLMNPIGLIVTAIGLAALTIYRYWEPIKAFFSGFFQGLKEGLGPVAAVFAPAFEAMASALSPLKPIWDGISSALSTAWEWVTNLLTPLKTTQQELDGATNAGHRFGLWLGGLGKSFVQVIADFTQFGSDLIDGLLTGISNKWSELKAKVSELSNFLPKWPWANEPVEIAVKQAAKHPALQPQKDHGFAGLYDKGGLIPAGKWGIAGENGPEVVEGPARVISRRHTAAMASAAMLASMPLAAMQPQLDTVRTIHEQVMPAALRQPADTARTIREQVMPAALRQPADTARTIREQVEPAALRQPVEATRRIREQVVPAALRQPVEASRTIREQVVPAERRQPAEATRTIREQVMPAELRQPADTARTIREQVMPAALRQPADTARTIREQVMPAALRQPVEASRTIREQVVPAALRQPVEASRTIREQVVPAALRQPADAYSRSSQRIIESPKLAPARGNSTTQIHAPIHIVQQPGQSGADVAQAVRRELDRRERQAAAQGRANLGDRN